MFINDLSTILDYGEVTDIIAYYHEDLPNEFAAICLQFVRGDIFILINPDDDTIIITRLSDSTNIPWDKMRVIPLTGEDHWSQIIGKEVYWIWRLENQQGYFDGIQIEFATKLHEKAITIQLLAIASKLESKLVKDIPALKNSSLDNK